jgi:hypothetical protein
MDWHPLECRSPAAEDEIAGEKTRSWREGTSQQGEKIVHEEGEASGTVCA